MYDPAKTARWCREAAEQGQSDSQCCLGYMLQDGVGVKKSEVEAMRWFKLGAALGHPQGQCGLAMGLLRRSNRARKNDAEAVRYLRKAANQGLKDAQVSLDHLRQSGRGFA